MKHELADAALNELCGSYPYHSSKESLPVWESTCQATLDMLFHMSC